MVETNTRSRRCRPAEAILLEDFRIKADPAAIPPHDADTVRPLGAEHIEGATERLCGAPHNRSYVSGEIMWRIRSCAGRGPSNLEFSAT